MVSYTDSIGSVFLGAILLYKLCIFIFVLLYLHYGIVVDITIFVIRVLPKLTESVERLVDQIIRIDALQGSKVKALHLVYGQLTWTSKEVYPPKTLKLLILPAHKKLGRPCQLVCSCFAYLNKIVLVSISPYLAKSASIIKLNIVLC